jgi:hypothetical protein
MFDKLDEPTPHRPLAPMIYIFNSQRALFQSAPNLTTSEEGTLTNMATRDNKPARKRAKRGQDFIMGGGQSPSAAAQGATFRPEEPSPPITPEREAARQLLNKEERKMVAAMERDLVRPLTEEEERLVLEPGPLIEQSPPK